MKKAIIIDALSFLSEGSKFTASSAGDKRRRAKRVSFIDRENCYHFHTTHYKSYYINIIYIISMNSFTRRISYTYKPTATTTKTSCFV